MGLDTIEEARRIREGAARLREEWKPATAQRLGKDVVGAERGLDHAFGSHTADEGSIGALTADVARLLGELRAEHLKTHLAQTALLTSEQVALYAELRGYEPAHGSGATPASALKRRRC
jgi:hypothetical protein